MVTILLGIRSVTDVLRAHCGLTPYTFYKPTLGLQYVSNRPYNEFIKPTTFILVENKAFSMDYCPWTQSMPSRDVNAATRLAEAMYSPSSGFTGMGIKKYAQFSDVRTMVLRTGQTRGPKSPIYCT